MTRRFLVSGSSGLIGSALVPALRGDGHEVVQLVRDEPGEGEAQWDPMGGRLDPAILDGVDVVVNLNGVGIGDRRWTDAHKRAVLESRVRSTALLAETVARSAGPPPVLLNASAVGYYGPRGDDVVDEDGPPGDDFVAGVVEAWEAATAPAAGAGARVVCMRSGIVLTARGGILERLLLPFKLGVGGRIGSGRQYWSWITLDDEVRAIRFLADADLAGPVNLTAPDPVPFDEVVGVLGRVLHRPTFLRAPKFAFAILFGRERARSLLFEGQRVVPTRLRSAGFEFHHPEFEEAIRHVLDRPAD